VKPRVAVIAALPREVAALVRGVRPDAALLRKGIHLHVLSNAVVVAAGMGASRASLAVEAAMASGRVECLVSAGLAGSCTAALLPGRVVSAATVIDTRTGERFSAMAAEESWALASCDAIASVSEKARLAETYDAALVDMEAATVARLALAHGISFQAIKAISDAHDFELASLARFATARGQFRTGGFALHTALRPHTWGRTIRLGRDSNRALLALNERLKFVLAEG
jgi:adenosylhomocysteine nucleosidase